MLEAFPPGTPKQYVDKALIDKAGAESQGKIDVSYAYPREHNVYSYEYQKPFYLRFLHDGRYVITIFYDQNDKVKDKVKMIDGRVMRGILISGPALFNS